MNSYDHCSICGARLPDGNRRGLCPACRLKQVGDGSEASRRLDQTVAERGQSVRHASVLETLAGTIGSRPTIMLRDTAPGEQPSGLVAPHSPEMPKPEDRIEKLQLFGEIARGGMGAILKGRDPDLGRELAVKVLLERHRNNPKLVRRFVEEAQIAGQLQHPGVTPVYELGTFHDARPYFTMKLVKGRTLAELLAERETPAVELSRFLSVFESVCQTMAYSHARGVIHRDLKPSNVMVGAYGEVQVMDWGLAKVLQRGGAIEDAEAGKVEVQTTVIATARGDTDLSQSGSIMGTPSYMAPEQARGEIDKIDERADVFALGSILCEILTGEAAFVGRNSGEIQRKAALGDLADAFNRLDASGADSELIELAKSCLAREPEDRPRDAQAVAERVKSYRDGVEERLRRAELERVEAQTRAEEEAKRRILADRLAFEERKRRRATLATAATLLISLSTLGAGSFFIFAQRAERTRRATDAVQIALAEVSGLEGRARRGDVEDLSSWSLALSAAENAEKLSRGEVEPAARTRASESLTRIRQGFADAKHAAELAKRDRALIDALAQIRDSKGDQFDPINVDKEYRAAFLNYGLDVDRLTPAELAERVKGRPLATRLEMAASLVEWAIERREGKNKRWTDLIALARAIDPDPTRDRLRALSLKEDIPALERFARETKPETLDRHSALLLGNMLIQAKNPSEAVRVLRATQVRHPNDLWINYTLGFAFSAMKPPRFSDAARYLTSARTIRPDLAHLLAHALEGLKATDEELELLREQVRLRPDVARHRYHLGIVLDSQGKLDEAIAEYRRAIELKPDYANAHNNLGNALYSQGKHDDAIAEFRRAIELKPDLAEAHYNLGNSLYSQGKHAEAIAEYRRAIELKPDYANAHNNLGIALNSQGKPDEAIAAFRRGIELKPDYALAHSNLGIALNSQGKHAEAIAAFRRAIELKPDYANAHNNLGNSLYSQGKHAEAIAEFRRAIELKPDYAEAHTNLGIALGTQGKLDKAIAEFRRAIELKSDYAEAHVNLGQALALKGEYAESLAELKRGHELGSKRSDWRYPSAEWVRAAERKLAAAERLPAVLKGNDTPKNPAEGLDFAQLCYDKGLYAAAAKLWSDALSQEPQLADDRQTQHRYNAACAAALAGSGKGKDEPSPDEKARAGLRKQALDWLRSERSAWAKLLESGPPQARPFIKQTLQHWKADADLSGVREKEALEKLPEEERQAWRELWQEVEGLLGKAKD